MHKRSRDQVWEPASTFTARKCKEYVEDMEEFQDSTEGIPAYRKDKEIPKRMRM